MSKITRNDLQKVLKKYHKKNTEIIKDMNDKIKTNSNFIDENCPKSAPRPALPASPKALAATGQTARSRSPDPNS